MADIMVTLQKLANENTAKTFKFNKEEAATSRKWQETMSNTSHQREVKDLIAAGLNPVLSSGGSGAQSYSTSSASGVADSAVNAIGNVESSRNSAAAIRYSADQSLKAAQQAAAAQRYAADRQYAATRYATDYSKSGTIAGVASRYAEKFFQSFGKQAKNEFQSITKNPKSIFNSGVVNANGGFTSSKKKVANSNNAYKLLNGHGYRQLSHFLMSNGYEPSTENINSVVKFMAGNGSAIIDLTPLNIARNSSKALTYIKRARWNLNFKG